MSRASAISIQRHRTRHTKTHGVKCREASPTTPHSPKPHAEQHCPAHNTPLSLQLQFPKPPQLLPVRTEPNEIKPPPPLPRSIGAAMAADAVRLRFPWRVVRAAEVLALAVLLSRSFPRLPCAAAAASSVLRVAAAAILQPRSIFILANAIVILLLALSRRDAASSSPPSRSPSPSSEGDAQEQEQEQFLPFSTAPLLLPPIDEAPEAASGKGGKEEEEEAVFEDKQAVHVVTVRAAQLPRRTRSEKAGTGGGGARRRAASPELRRAESENGRRRRSVSAAAPEEWGAEDEEEFRRAVEAFIAKQQTRFHREESLVAVAGVDCAVAGAAAAVKLIE